MQRLHLLWSRYRPLAVQFTRYLLSGGTAAALELGSYRLLLWMGIWYMTAVFISGGVGTVAAFLFHKYLVFRKRERTIQHAARYAVLVAWNILSQAAIVYVLVEFLAVDPMWAKVLGIGANVTWNFFLYKFLVYV